MLVETYAMIDSPIPLPQMSQTCKKLKQMQRRIALHRMWTYMETPQKLYISNWSARIYGDGATGVKCAPSRNITKLIIFLVELHSS